MPNTCYVCSSCGRAFDENDNPIDLRDDELSKLIEFESTECKECFEYAKWENEKYFNK
jgi:DNA-directed RNA polymerase subunit RPC12/RpoP